MKNIVIGSGPAGRLGSLELGKLGEEVTLIEKNHIAGTCLNEGCMVICALTDITKQLKELFQYLCCPQLLLKIQSKALQK